MAEEMENKLENYCRYCINRALFAVYYANICQAMTRKQANVRSSLTNNVEHGGVAKIIIHISCANDELMLL